MFYFVVISSCQTKERIIRGFGVFGLVVGWVWFIYDLLLFSSLDLKNVKASGLEYSFDCSYTKKHLFTAGSVKSTMH